MVFGCERMTQGQVLNLTAAVKQDNPGSQGLAASVDNLSSVTRTPHGARKELTPASLFSDVTVHVCMYTPPL